jgi:hypothetical protein
MRLRLFLLAVICLLARPAFAQDGEDPESSARFHLGSIRIAPSVAVRNIGIDTNVFNDIDTPRSDFTATIGGNIDMWWHVGRARLNSTHSIDFVYFNQYVGQRSVNPGNQIRVDVPLNRIRSYASVSVLTSHERATPEIDARAAHTLTTHLAGSEVRLTGKLALDVNGSRSRTAYRDVDDPFGSILHSSLTSHALQTNVAVRYASTPLTTLVLAVEQRRDLFDFSPERDANSISIKPRVEFKRSALVSGSASVGYRRFRPNRSLVPGFAGTVADVNLAYTLMGTTRFSTQISRDVNFSFESLQPYYLLTGMAASIDRHVAGPWDALARVGNQKLSYRSMGPLIGSLRMDVVANYGVSLAYRLAHNRRIAVDFDSLRRRSSATNRSYHGFRFGISASYPL